MDRASGASLFGLHLAACRGQLPAPVALGPGVWGKAIVYATRTVAAPTRPPGSMRASWTSRILAM